MKKLAVAAALTAGFVLVMHGLAHAKPRHHGRHHRLLVEPRLLTDPNGNRVIGSRPADCPHAWCGCGLRKFLGLTDKSLNLAWEWARKFPRTIAHEGAVAVRRHHVMQLVSHVSGTTWMVRSYNDYRRLAWIRARDVSGFVFVDVSRRFAWAQ